MERPSATLIHPTSLVAAFVPAKHLGDERSLRKAKLLILFYGVSALFLAAFAGFYHLIGYPIGVWSTTYGACVVPLLLFIFHRTGSFAFTTGVFNVNAILMFTLLIYGTGGIDSCIVPWLAIIPASGFVFDGWRRGMAMSLICLVEIIVLFILEASGVPLPSLYPPENHPILNVVVQVGLLIYIFVILMIYEVSRERTIVQLDALNADLSHRKAEVEQQKEALTERNLQIADINATLEAQVISRTHKLRQAKKELDTFLYEAAHALRRPIARIMGLVSILRDEPGLTPTAQVMQQHIDSSTTLMDQMLYKLVMVSELDTRQLQLAPVSIAASVANVLQTRAQALEAAKTQPNIAIPAGINLDTDAFLLELALGLILDNAIQYTGKTGRQPEIVITAAEGEKGLTIRIQDNGLGIPASEISRVTEMFFRATEKVPGGGLGLYVAQKALDLMHGTLLIQSELGVGTTVSITLPRSLSTRR